MQHYLCRCSIKCAVEVGKVGEALGRGDKPCRQLSVFVLHYYANAKIIKQSSLLFPTFVMAMYVNTVAQAWTFIRAVSSLPCATILHWMLSADLLYPQAVWSNQRRAALIAWPWQEARWSGMGLHLPEERSPLFLSSCSLLSFLSFHLLPQPSTRKLQSILWRDAAKSPQPNAHLIFQAPMHLG